MNPCMPRPPSTSLCHNYQGAGLCLTFGRVRADLALAVTPPDIISQQADFILQVCTDLDAAVFLRVQSDLESVDVALHAPKCILGLVLQPPQLVLHLPAQVAVLPQHLHLRHDSVKVFAVISRQSLDLPDVVAQVQHLG